MRLITIACVSLMLCGCAAFAGNNVVHGKKNVFIDSASSMDDATNTPGMPSITGGKSCDFSTQPMMKPRCTTSCEDGRWVQNCIPGMPSTTGGDSCDFGTQPMLKPGCMNSCENGTWKQQCP
jgi:hypothetical protein